MDGNKRSTDFPVVCVGGSAGGLDAYIRLLRHLPPNLGVAIVIVNHLRIVATQLHEILPRYTEMPVELITEGLVLQPNHVFIIPPQRDLHVLDGEFHLKPISKPRGWPDVITVFLCSLVQHWPPRRRRFSLAHEIGHWTHHRGRFLVCRADDINRGGENRPVMEKTADRYAANLLMPFYLLRPALSEHKRFTFQTVKVKAIADLFNVSRSSAAIQMIEARYAPALLVCHGPQGRKWFCRSSDVPDWWFPQNDLDSASFAFDVLFGGKQDCPSPRKVGADAWFDRRGAERYELREQTIRTGDDEVLTLLLIEDDGMLG